MDNFFQKHKYEIGIFIVFLIIAGVSGIYSLKNSNDQLPISKQIQNSQITTPNSNVAIQQFNNLTISPTSAPDHTSTSLSASDITTSLADNGSMTQSNNDTAAQMLDDTILITQPPPETYQLKAVTYTLLASDYTQFLSSTSTVYNLMQLAAIDSRKPFIFETKSFGSMGLFVESINGIKNNSKTNKYWIYYLNGQSAQMGISQQIIKLDDVIEWKYETPNM